MIISNRQTTKLQYDEKFIQMYHWEQGLEGVLRDPWIGRNIERESGK